jgi:toxin YoeB
MRKILLEDNAVEDFEFWSKNDLKILKKIAELFIAISKNPFEGIGKPELLKGNLTGYWSRRINEEHRIVYAVDQEKIVVISCRYHYEFK